CAGSYVPALRIGPVPGRKFAPHAITGVHDRSASRISGRTRAAVCVTCVSALRIAVLECAGSSPAIVSANLSAEKTWRVKLFRSRAQNLQFSKRRCGPSFYKISARDTAFAAGRPASGGRQKAHDARNTQLDLHPVLNPGSFACPTFGSTCRRCAVAGFGKRGQGIPQGLGSPRDLPPQKITTSNWGPSAA